GRVIHQWPTWPTPHAVGLAVTPSRWTRRVATSIATSRYRRRNMTVSRWKKVDRQQASGLVTQEHSPTGVPLAGRRADTMVGQDGPVRPAQPRPAPDLAA